MSTAIWKKSVWKKIGIALGALVLTIFIIASYVWIKYIYIPGPEIEVQFNSIDARLSGKLMLPNKQGGPFPAVIILHGPGPVTDDGLAFKIQAKAFLKRGFAVLTYDKRGTGRSTGVFRDQDYHHFISDIHRAVDFMKSRREILDQGIGLATNSESGLFAPQLASERQDIAFIYNRVAPVVDFAGTFANQSYDPRDHFRKRFDTPLYYAFAAKDTKVPTQDCVENLHRIMERSEHNIRYKIWPNVDHTMSKASFILYGAYPKGYLEEMVDWAKSVVDEKLEKQP